MPGETFSNSRKELSPLAVGSESVNELGDSPPPAVIENCCGASGWASSVTLIAPSLSFDERADDVLVGSHVDVRG